MLVVVARGFALEFGKGCKRALAMAAVVVVWVRANALAAVLVLHLEESVFRGQRQRRLEHYSSTNVSQRTINRC